MIQEIHHTIRVIIFDIYIGVYICIVLWHFCCAYRGK